VTIRIINQDGLFDFHGEETTVRLYVWRRYSDMTTITRDEIFVLNE